MPHFFLLISPSQVSISRRGISQTTKRPISQTTKTMSNINANATVTLTVNGKQAQDMLDNLKRKSQDLEKAIENAAKAGNKQ